VLGVPEVGAKPYFAKARSIPSNPCCMSLRRHHSTPPRPRRLPSCTKGYAQYQPLWLRSTSFCSTRFIPGRSFFGYAWRPSSYTSHRSTHSPAVGERA